MEGSAAGSGAGAVARPGWTGAGRRPLLLALAIFVVGAALRINGFSTFSIHGDEVYTISETRSARTAAAAVSVLEAWQTRLDLIVSRDTDDPPGISKGEIWRLRWGYRTNLLQLLLNEVSYQLFGESPEAFRLQALLFGLLALIVLPLLMRRLAGDGAALLLLAFIAFCPDHVEMSRLGRYPSACFFFSGMAALSLVLFTKYRRPRDELVFLGALVLLVASHLTSALVATTLLLYGAFIARGRWSLRAVPVIVLLGLAAYYFGPGEKIAETIDSGIQVPSWTSPWWKLAIALIYNTGPAMVALALLAVAMGWARWRRDRSGLPPQGADPTHGILPLALTVVLPALALFWMGRTRDVGTRYFGAVQAAGIVAAALGAHALLQGAAPTRWRAWAVGLALASQAPLLVSNAIDGQRYDWSGVADRIHVLAAPQDRVLSDWAGIIEYYLDRRHHNDRHIMEMPGNLPTLEERLREVRTNEGATPRAFLVFEKQRGTLVWPGKRREKVEEWLARHAVHRARFGHRRLDAFAYWYELEIYEVDLNALRARPG